VLRLPDATFAAVHTFRSILQEYVAVKTRLSLRLSVALAFIASSQILSAQLTLYTMQSGIEETAGVAASGLAADVVLVQAGALGDPVVDAGAGSAHLIFDLASGMANV
jgi:hypothetical protein